MKRYTHLHTFLVLLGLLFAGSNFAQDQHSAVAQQVFSAKQNRTVFQQVDLFTPSTERAEVTFDKVLSKGTILDLDVSATRTTTQDLPDAIRLEIPTGQRERIELELVRVEILTDDFTLLTNESDERPVDYTPGAYYRGIVAGDPYSVAAISIFDGEVSGIIGDNVYGNRILGKIQDNARGEQHILYSEHDLLVLPDFECGTEDSPLSAEDMDLMRQIASGDYVDNRDATNCVRVYLELEYDLVTEKGGATGATNFITAVWNMVATLYQNESINTEISQIFTWTTPDSYPTNGTSNALTAFRTARPNYNGDLAHLISRGAPSGGGVAWVNALCSNYGYAYSWINSSYAQIPTYSWTVNVLTHEMGHNLGSSHTHACVWNGNNTPIDGCAPTYNPQYSEGCVGPVPNKGTIMSYCHLLSNVGIDLNLGFGPQPGALIRNRVYNANCLTACSGSGACHSVSINKNDVSCNGGNNGSATATPQGGTGPFTYNWSNGATTSTVNNLSAGSYSVTVSDGGSCNIVSSVTIAQPNAISLNLQPTAAAGGNNGAVNLTVSGGTAPYSYSWSNGSSSQDISGLAPGTYSVTVTDNNNCSNSGSVQVIDATQGCNGTSVRLTIDFDNYPGDISWNLTNASGATVASGGNYTTAGGTYTEIFCLPDGCYDFQISDSYGDGLCTAYNGNTLGGYSLVNLNDNSTLAGSCDFATGETTNFCVGNQDPALNATASGTDLDCRGDNSGTATASATGGNGSYSYAWSNGGNTQTITGLNAGSYTVTVTSGSQTATASVTISQPSVLNVTATGNDATSGNNGSASASATGGTAPYTYAWNNGSTGASINGLGAGTYTVTVTDNNGCTDTDNVTIQDNTPALTISTSVNNVSCNGGNDGSATVSAGGGTGSYTYNWSNGASSATVSNLGAGTYGVTVTSGSQTQTASVSISQPTALTVTTSSTAVTSGNNGTATASAGGGTSPYAYSWSNGGNGATINNLASGSYSVTVTDANNCTATGSVVVNDNTPTGCNGTEVELTINFDNWPGDISWTLNNAAGTSVASGANYTGAGSTYNETFCLPDGCYDFVITDSYGDGICTPYNGSNVLGDYTLVNTTTGVQLAGSCNFGGGETTNFCLGATPDPDLTISASGSDLDCFGDNSGSATVSANGGNGSYSYAWSNGGNGANINGLGAGTYTVTVTSGTQTETTSVNIGQPAALNVTASATAADNGNNGTAAAAATGGTGGKSYSWSNGATGATISGLAPGTYTVTATDANGCTATTTTIVQDNNGGGTTNIVYEYGSVSSVGENWTNIFLQNTYVNPVIVATVVNNNTFGEPVVVRIGNANSVRFTMRIQRPGATTNNTYQVQYFVVEAGTYTIAEHGVKMEAGKIAAQNTQSKANWSTGNFESVNFANAYSNPVVVGQVMSQFDDNWSVFWGTRIGSRTAVYNGSGFAGVKHVGEDPNTTRAAETVGYVVIESGTGVMPDGKAFAAGVGADIVRGMSNSSSGYAYNLNNLTVEGAVLSSAAMDGGDGGWPVFTSTPNGNSLYMAIDEDQVSDSERSHTTEQVAYLAFGLQTGGATPAGMPAVTETPGDETATEMVLTELNVFPNPARDVLTVEFDFSGSETVTFMVTDMMGRQVGQLRENRDATQAGRFQMDVSNFQAGYYILHAVGTEGRQTKKFSVVR